MAQIKTFTWTNASSAVARDQDVGFVVAEATTVDTTNAFVTELSVWSYNVSTNSS